MTANSAIHAIRTAALAAAVLSALASLPRSANGSAQDLYGFGARGPALAGAATASTEGAEAVWYNPAGLGASGRTELMLGAFGAWTRLRASGTPAAEQAASSESTSAFTLGAAVPLPLPEPIDDRVALGLGLFVPHAVVLRADIAEPYQPRFFVVGNRANALSIQAAASVRITDWLSVGGGVRALAKLVGSISVAPTPQGTLSSAVRDELRTDLAATAGILLNPGWFGLSLGVAYRGEQRSSFSLPLDADLGESFPLDIPTLNIEGVAHFDPRQIQVGLAWKGDTSGGAVSARAEVDLLWRQWSAAPRPIENTTAAVAPQSEIGARDTVSVRAGGEIEFRWEHWALSTRVGYGYEPSPFAPQTGPHALLDSPRHLWALGLGGAYLGDGPTAATFRLDAFFQHHWLTERTHHRGDQLEGAAGPPGAVLRNSGQLFATGVSLTVGL